MSDETITVHRDGGNGNDETVTVRRGNTREYARRGRDGYREPWWPDFCTWRDRDGTSSRRSGIW